MSGIFNLKTFVVNTNFKSVKKIDALATFSTNIPGLDRSYLDSVNRISVTELKIPTETILQFDNDDRITLEE